MRISVPAYLMEGSLEFYRQLPGYHTGAFSYDLADVGQVKDNIFLIPIIIGKRSTVTKSSIRVTIGHASSARMGLYSTGPDNKPYALMADFGEVDCAVAAEKTIVGLTSLLNALSLYWIAVLFEGTPTCTSIPAKSRLGIMGSASANFGPYNCFYFAQAYGPLSALLDSASTFRSATLSANVVLYLE
jgi:hypothetical protein